MQPTSAPLPLWCATGQEVGEKCAVEHEKYSLFKDHLSQIYQRGKMNWILKTMPQMSEFEQLSWEFGF